VSADIAAADGGFEREGGRWERIGIRNVFAVTGYAESDGVGRHGGVRALDAERLEGFKAVVGCMELGARYSR